jgi:hypothetical protein
MSKCKAVQQKEECNIVNKLVRYYPPAGSSCSVREPDMWPSFRSTATTVQGLIPQLRKDVLVPPEFGMYVLVRDEQATAGTSGMAPMRWAQASELPQGNLPPGPVVDVRVVEAPSRSPGQPMKVNGPWGPVWF